MINIFYIALFVFAVIGLVFVVLDQYVCEQESGRRARSYCLLLLLPVY